MLSPYFLVDLNSHILFIEDDPIMIFILKSQMRRIFKQEPKKVLVKENGKLALDYLLSDTESEFPKPNLIILDLNMPVMNGWEFLEHKQKDCTLAEIPVIVLTSSVNRDDVTRAQQYSSVVDFKSKPLSGEDLKEIIFSYTNFSDI